MDIRKFIRYIFTWIAVLFISAIASEYIVSYGHEQGWFNNVSGKIKSIMDFLTTYVNHPYFIWASFTTAGLTIGIWLDYYFKKRETYLDSTQILNHRDDWDLARRNVISS